MANKVKVIKIERFSKNMFVSCKRCFHDEKYLNFLNVLAISVYDWNLRFFIVILIKELLCFITFSQWNWSVIEKVR